MTRYYIRIVLGMVAVLVASVVAVAAIFSTLQDDYFRPDLGEQIVALEADLGERLAGLSELEAAKVLKEMGDSMVFEARVVRGGEPAFGAPFFVRPGGAEYLVALSPDPVRVRRFKSRQGVYLVASLAAVGAIIAAVGAFMVLPLVRKLRVQEATILKIAEGDLDARAPVESGEALGRLGARINQMASRIQVLVSRQRELVHAVSHEMRTPCARLGFGLELLEESRDDEERSRRIAAMHEDVRELDDLLEELLMFLRSDQPGELFSGDAIELAPVVAQLAEKIGPFRSGVTIDVDVPGGFIVHGHSRYLPRALENLLVNAVRHAACHVRIRASRSGDGHSVIDVDDDGHGIEEPDRERIFEPFVRTDASRDRQSGGAGLGLAIVRRVVERHGGAVTAGMSELGGARFQIILPESPPKQSETI